jgi:folate-dependent phosphoribosylglycinamide formyltransferase PurN
MTEKTPIALLIGGGSRVGPLIEHQVSGASSYEITMVITHKKLKAQNEAWEDVAGIKAAKDAKIFNLPLNYAQMREDYRDALGINMQDSASKEVFERQYRKWYSGMLGIVLSQKYSRYSEKPHKPRAVLMQGYDIVLSQEALRHFPVTDDHQAVLDGASWFINFHPAQLPDLPGESSVRLPVSGHEIPVLRGEHDEVIQAAIDLGLPALGGCAHLVTPNADEGGYVIGRYEVPIHKGDTLKTYDARLVPKECQFTLEIAELVGKGRLRVKNRRVMQI